LTLQHQKHSEWLFGGIAELVHNASDAGATQLNISHFYDDVHKEDVLEILDNGDGMTPDVVKNKLLSFGGDYDPGNRDLARIGCYGVGFKQGTMRVGSTAVFITKSVKTGTISLGILCNRPFEERNDYFVYQHATLMYPSCRVSKEYSSEDEYESTAKMMADWSFLNREQISLVINARFSAGK
jgi:hypothetical protein